MIKNQSAVKSATWWLLCTLSLVAVGLFVAGLRICQNDSWAGYVLIILAEYYRYEIGVICVSAFIAGIFARKLNVRILLYLYLCGLVLAIVIPMVTSRFQGGCSAI